MEEDADDKDYQPQSPSFANASPSSSPPNATSKSGSGGGGPCMDDSWSEGVTPVLIDARGKRYLERNRPRIRLEDRKEVTDTVSCPKIHTGILEETGMQFIIDRMDSLKRHYKEEKQNIIAAGGSERSNWLRGFTGRKQKQRETSERFLPKSKRMRTDRIPNLNWNWNRNLEAKVRGSSEGMGRNCGASASELTQAVGWLVEVYERVENSKMEKAMEMEKQRMEFEKQRMQFIKGALSEMQMNRNRKIEPGNQEQKPKRKRKQEDEEESEHGTEQEPQQEQEK